MPKHSITIKRTIPHKCGHSEISIEVVSDSSETIDDDDLHVSYLINEALTQLGSKLHPGDRAVTEDSEVAPIEPPIDPATTLDEDLNKKINTTVSEPRRPSAYNLFMQSEVPRLKALEPELGAKEYFIRAAKAWTTSPFNPRVKAMISEKPIIPSIIKLEESDYQKIESCPSDLYKYNLFSPAIFNAKGIRDSMIRAIRSNSQSMQLLEHIASYLDLKTDDDCSSFLSGLIVSAACDLFIEIVKSTSQKSVILKNYILNGCDVKTIGILGDNCKSPNEFDFLINEMGLMQSKLNMDVLKHFILEFSIGRILMLIAAIKKHICPITIDNILEVNELSIFVMDCDANGQDSKKRILDALFN